MLQDSRGFMWFGTEDGLNKYDGYEFTVYRHNSEDSLSISGNWIYALYESHYNDKHVLWIGSSNGLSRMDLETELITQFRHDPNDQNSLINDWIISIDEDSYGYLWIGTNVGICKLNRVTGKFTGYRHDPNNPYSLSANKWCMVHESVTHEDTILWVGTWDGLNKFDRQTEKFTHYKPDISKPNSINDNNIAYLFTDTSGILWISTQNGGLNKLNIKTGQFLGFTLQGSERRHPWSVGIRFDDGHPSPGLRETLRWRGR